eukprot:SAG22_NODE_388_length_11295_cov_14.512594_12_plen_72_part_00
MSGQARVRFDFLDRTWPSSRSVVSTIVSTTLFVSENMPSMKQLTSPSETLAARTDSRAAEKGTALNLEAQL